MWHCGRPRPASGTARHPAGAPAQGAARAGAREALAEAHAPHPHVSRPPGQVSGARAGPAVALTGAHSAGRTARPDAVPTLSAPGWRCAGGRAERAGGRLGPAVRGVLALPGAHGAVRRGRADHVQPAGCAATQRARRAGTPRGHGHGCGPRPGRRLRPTSASVRCGVRMQA